ncbi:hypothetical protein LXL04_033840 [Taraxacum kok-saghyz]
MWLDGSNLGTSQILIRDMESMETCKTNKSIGINRRTNFTALVGCMPRDLKFFASSLPSSLVRLSLANSNLSTDSFPTDFSCLPMLEKLYLDHNPIDSMPQCVRTLPKIKSLSMMDCNKLKSVEHPPHTLTELSLYSDRDAYTKKVVFNLEMSPLKVHSFSRSSAPGPYEFEGMIKIQSMVDVDDKVLRSLGWTDIDLLKERHVGTNSSESKFQMIYEFGIFSTMYECEEMPNWVRHRSVGPSISFTIPSSPNNLRGLNFSSVHLGQVLDEFLDEVAYGPFPLTPMFTVSNITKNRMWIYERFRERSCNGGNCWVLLSHWMFGRNEMEGGDHVTITVTERYGELIKECGVSLVYDIQDEEEEDALDYYKSWNHIIGGDLSPFQTTTGEYILNNFQFFLVVTYLFPYHRKFIPDGPDCQGRCHLKKLFSCLMNNLKCKLNKNLCGVEYDSLLLFHRPATHPAHLLDRDGETPAQLQSVEFLQDWSTFEHIDSVFGWFSGTGDRTRFDYYNGNFDRCHGVELVVIDLSYCNKLEKLPENLYKLKKVKTMWLDGSNLGTSQILIRDMESMETCKTNKSIGINRRTNFTALVGCMPRYLKFFASSLPSSLVRLSLANSNLSTDSFPTDFSCLPMLEKLYLDHNPIDSMPQCVRTLPKIKSLSMMDCNKLKSVEHPPHTLTELSLYSDRDAYTKKVVFNLEMSPLKVHSFSRSSAPRPYEFEGMIKIQSMVDVDDKVLRSLGWTDIDLLKERHVGTNSSESKFQMIYEFGIFSTMYECEEMPNWVRHRSVGPSISFTIPSSPNNLRGLNFSSVHLGQVLDEFVDEVAYGPFPLTPMFTVSNITKNRMWIYERLRERCCNGGNCWVLLSHWMFGRNEMEGGDHVTITVTERYGELIKECGVSLVYDIQDEEEEDALDYYKSWNHIIGGDLSPFQTTTGEYILNNFQFFLVVTYLFPYHRKFIPDGPDCQGRCHLKKLFSCLMNNLKCKLNKNLCGVEYDSLLLFHRPATHPAHLLDRDGETPAQLQSVEFLQDWSTFEHIDSVFGWFSGTGDRTRFDYYNGNFDRCHGVELVVIDLSYCNKLEKLPENLYKLKKVKTMWLDGSNLGTSQILIRDMESMETCKTNKSIGINRRTNFTALVGCMPRDLKFFASSLPSSLVRLSLANSNLSTDSFPTDFSCLPMLEKLYLDHNPIDSMPQCVRTLPKIKSLSMMDCNKLKSVEHPPHTLTELSLYSDRDAYTKKVVFNLEMSPLKVHSFSRSSAPGPYEFEGMIKIQSMVDVDDKVLRSLGWTDIDLLKERHVGTNSSESKFQMIYEFGIFSTMYECEEMPNWVRHRSVGPSISFTIPSSPNNLRGLNFSSVHLGQVLDEFLDEVAYGPFPLTPMFTVSNITKNRMWIYERFRERSCNGGNCWVLLSHWMFGRNEMEGGDHVTITVTERYGELIKECGVSLVYDIQDEEEEDALDYYKSWNHIIGGDLSPFQTTTGEYILNNFQFFLVVTYLFPYHRKFIPDGPDCQGRCHLKKLFSCLMNNLKCKLNKNLCGVEYDSLLLFHRPATHPAHLLDRDGETPAQLQSVEFLQDWSTFEHIDSVFGWFSGTGDRTRFDYYNGNFDRCHGVELVVIDLSYCNKLEKLPENLYKLKKVKTMWLDGSNLGTSQILIRDMESMETCKTNKSIGINRRTNFTALVGCMPRDLKFFASSLPSSLVRLSLANSNLSTDSFPTDFSCLPMLEKLYLDHNPIDSMPQCVRTLPKIKSLSMMDCNKLKSVEHPPHTLTELSLYSDRDAYTKKVVFNLEMSPLKVHSFSRSSAPGPYEFEGMIKIQSMVDVDDKVLRSLGWTDIDLLKERHVGTNSSESKFQMIYDIGIFSTMYECEEMPNWVRHRSVGPSISFTIPSSPNNLRGLNFSSVHLGQVLDEFLDEVAYGPFPLTPMFTVSNITKNRMWIYERFRERSCNGGNCWVLLSHWMFGRNEMEGGDHVTITVTERYGELIKECGVSLVYDIQDEEEEDALDYYKSWNHIIGGDLSPFQTTTGEYILNNFQFFLVVTYLFPYHRKFIPDGPDCQGRCHLKKLFSCLMNNLKCKLNKNLCGVEYDSLLLFHRPATHPAHLLDRDGETPAQLQSVEFLQDWSTFEHIDSVFGWFSGTGDRTRFDYYNGNFDRCHGVELVVIDLSYCNKLEKLPENLYKLKKVKTMWLDGSNLGTSQILIRDMESMETCKTNKSIGINRRTNFTALVGCMPRDLKFFASSLPSSLVRLSLANSNLSTDSFPTDFSCLPMLEKLYLDHNPIDSMPQCVRTLPKIKSLSMMDCNKLKSVEHPPHTLTELSLYSDRDAYTKKVVFNLEMSPLKVHSFSRSSAPGPYEFEGMIKIQSMVDVDDKVLRSLGWTDIDLLKERHVGTNSSESKFQMIYEFGIFSTMYECEEMPNWVRHRSVGPSISFTIPSSPNNLRGLNFSSVHLGQVLDEFLDEVAYGPFPLTPMFTVSNITKNRMWIYERFRERSSNGGNCWVLLSHWMFGRNEMEGGDHVTITVTERYGELIKECGVSLVYDIQDEEEEDALDYYKSWNHIIGGDLSPFQTTTGEYILNNFQFFLVVTYLFPYHRKFIPDGPDCQERYKPWFRALSPRKPNIISGIILIPNFFIIT